MQMTVATFVVCRDIIKCIQNDAKLMIINDSLGKEFIKKNAASKPLYTWLIVTFHHQQIS
jgi:hypothetical protein